MAIKDALNGWPSILPVILTSPFVPKNFAESGHTTYVQPPWFGLFSSVAEKDYSA
jgi:hypothetical protein